MANTVWFDCYDFSANERCFTPEEMDTVRDLLSRGERVWMAPVRIDCEGQLETMRVSRSRCCVLWIGPEKMRVCFTPADEATYRFLLSEVNREHKAHLWSRRCLVPGERQDYIRCPMCNRCSDCPYGLTDGQREPVRVSREAMLEKGNEVAIDWKSPDEVIPRRMVALEVFENVCRKNENAGRAFLLKEVYGYDVPEIAQMMGTTERNVYYFASEGKRLAREEWTKVDEE